MPREVAGSSEFLAPSGGPGACDAPASCSRSRKMVPSPGEPHSANTRSGALTMAMATWQPDPSFYPSPRQAAKGAPETLAYVAAFDPARKAGDAIATVDLDPASPTYSKILGTVTVPNAGDEFHHFGWNACSSCLCPNAPHPHVERRYLVVPGLRSSRIYIFDTKPDPRKPKLVKTIEPDELAD